ncbi:MAG TPA: acetyl-CoA C-acyltransferase [Spongiibacteraceae bacterium]|jgi:acetyl-CoA C-acetyltransferase
MATNSVVILGGARTPMGGLQGSLSGATAVELGTTAAKAAIERAGIKASDIEEVLMGCVLPAGLKQGPARQVGLNAGIPNSAGCVTVNKLCGSGMQAAIFAFDQIAAGSYTTMLAGGMESMTNAPHLLPGARAGVRTGHVELKDHMFFDALEDPYHARLMGSFAQDTADANNLTRVQMDAFAIESLQRAQRAIKDGSLEAEIVPVAIKTRQGETIIKDDEQPLTAKLDKIPNLKPAFKKDGTITAANSSSISDGASALVLMNENAAKARGIRPFARMLGHARHSHEPELFTIAPIGAIQKLLKKIGWTANDVDLWEINEAFALVTMLAMRDLGLDHNKVNVHGGACAQGHPVGSTGSRLIITLMHALQKYGKKRGIAALCIGGGEALAVAIELV